MSEVHHGLSANVGVSGQYDRAVGTVFAPVIGGAVRSPTVTKPLLRVLAVVSLIAVGLALLVLGSVSLLDNSAPGASTVAKKSTTSVTAPPKDQGGTTTTTVSSTDTTTPGKTSVRSESVAAALFGLGAIVFLIGVFFGRIQEVTLPGGGGFKLSPKAQEAVKEKVAEKVEQDPTLTADPKTAITLYEAALTELQGMSGVPPRELAYPAPPVGIVLETSPGDDALDEAIDRAAKTLR
jgi:hypothetical protein